jgi:hypothetical protein
LITPVGGGGSCVCMQSWERMSYLLHMSCVSKSGISDHLTNVIMHAFLSEGGLSREQVASKLVCFRG